MFVSLFTFYLPSICVQFKHHIWSLNLVKYIKVTSKFQNMNPTFKQYKQK